MTLLPLAGQSCPQQVSSNYANVAKYIQYIFKVQYITYHWQMFLGTSPALSRYLPTMQIRPKLYILKTQYITHHWHIQLCKWCRRNSRQRRSPVLVGKIILLLRVNIDHGVSCKLSKVIGLLCFIPTSTSYIGGASAFLSPSSKQCSPGTPGRSDRAACSGRNANSLFCSAGNPTQTVSSATKLQDE